MALVSYRFGCSAALLWRNLHHSHIAVKLIATRVYQELQRKISADGSGNQAGEYVTFQLILCRSSSLLFRATPWEPSRGEADELLQVCLSPGLTVAGKCSNFSMLWNAKTCKLVLNKTLMVRVGHFGILQLTGLHPLTLGRADIFLLLSQFSPSARKINLHCSGITRECF